MNAENINDGLLAFRRVFFNPPTPPIFILELEDIEKLAFKMPSEIKVFPLSWFVDDQGRVHFEINYSSYSPKNTFWNRLKWLVRPDKYFYEVLRSDIIEGSQLRHERHLIGGGVCTYYADRKELRVNNFGILPKSKTQHIKSEIRRKAFELLSGSLRPLGLWLGVEKLVTTPCVIPVEKMKKLGWDIKVLSLKVWLKMFRDSFPLGLVKKQYIFEIPLCEKPQEFSGVFHMAKAT